MMTSSARDYYGALGEYCAAVWCVCPNEFNCRTDAIDPGYDFKLRNGETVDVKTVTSERNRLTVDADRRRWGRCDLMILTRLKDPIPVPNLTELFGDEPAFEVGSIFFNSFFFGYVEIVGWMRESEFKEKAHKYKHEAVDSEGKTIIRNYMSVEDWELGSPRTLHEHLGFRHIYSESFDKEVEPDKQIN